MSGVGVEVGAQSVREKQGHPVRFQREGEVVEEGIGVFISATAEVEARNHNTISTCLGLVLR